MSSRLPSGASTTPACLLLKSEIGSAKICCHNGKVKVPLYDIPDEPPAERSAARNGAGANGAEEARGGRVDAPAGTHSSCELVTAARRILSHLTGDTAYDKWFRKHLRRFKTPSQSVRRLPQPAG